MTFVQRRVSQRDSVVRPVALAQVLVSPVEVERVRVREVVGRHTVRPVAAQRLAVQVPLRAAALDRQEVQRLQQERQAVQAQLGVLPAVSERPPALVARSVPVRPVTAEEWVAVLRHRAEGVEGRRLDSRAFGEFQALQRHVAQVVVEGFRADRGEALARYASFGEQLAALQRHALCAPVARVVMGLVPSVERVPLQRATDVALRRFEAQEQAALRFETVQVLQRQLAELDVEATLPVLARIQARRGAGNPLPEGVRRHLEWGLNHDLSRVRIHDDVEADKLAKGVNAVAFTTGADIFFRSGQFNPNTQSGLELLAHEVTHAVQQSQGRVGGGIDPDAGLEVEARAMGAKLSRVMPSPKSLMPPVPHRGGLHAPGVYTAAAALGRVEAGAAGHALLTPLRALQRQSDVTVQRSVFGVGFGALAGQIPGYTPLTMVLGFDPVVGRAVKADPNVLLDALGRFVPGPFRDMVRVVRDQNLLPKAWAWFQGELGKLQLGRVVTDLRAALGGLPNLGKAKAILTGAASRVRQLVLGSARKLADIALTAITAGLGPVGKRLMGQLRQAGDIVTQVLKNPGQFAANLMNALKQGFMGFVGRSGQWIQQGLGDWLSGSTSIQFPRNLNVEGVLMTALSIMNLGYDVLRARLIRELGPGAEGKVALLEKAGGALGQLRGNVGKAPELRAVASQLSGEVLGGIKADVTETLVKKGVQRVALMFSPAGAAVGAILTAWNTIQTVVDKGQQIMGVIMTALGSVREIAAGRVAGAAQFIEQTIGRALPVVFSFAGRMLGIGNIGARLKKLVQGLRKKLGVDQLLNAVMKRLKKVLGVGRQAAATGVARGGRAVRSVASRLTGVITPLQRFEVGRERHSVWVEMKGRRPTIMVASTPAEAMTHLAGLRRKCVTLGVHARPNVRSSLARAAELIGSERRRMAAIFDEAESLGGSSKAKASRAHFGAGRPDPERSARLVAKGVREALKVVYVEVDNAQRSSAAVMIAGRAVSDADLNRLILQAVHASARYINLQNEVARHTSTFTEHKEKGLTPIAVELGPNESFAGIFKAAKDLPGKFGLRVTVKVRQQPTGKVPAAVMDVKVTASKGFVTKVALFVTKGGSYSVRNAGGKGTSGGHHQSTDLICRDIERICEETGFTEQDLSRALSVFSRTRVLPPKLMPAREKLSVLLSVISGAETSRGVTNIATEVMLFNLVGQGKMTFKEAFEGRQFTRFGGGTYPFSMQGGERGSRVFEERLTAVLSQIASGSGTGATGPKATAESKEFEQRAANLARLWLQSQGTRSFSSEQAFINVLVKRIR